MPLGLRSHGSSGIGATWADSLVVGSDGPERPLDDTGDALVKQEQLFEATFQDVDTVLEVGLATRPGGRGWRPGASRLGIEEGGGRVGINLGVRPIGEQPV